MKRIEKVAVVLVVLWFCTLVVTPLTSYLTRVVFHQGALADQAFRLSMTESALLTVRLIIRALVHIGVAIWLFFEASRESAAKWIWGLFGLTFGINAAILYFLIQLIETMRSSADVKGVR